MPTETKSEIALPIIHLNGSNASDLATGYHNAAVSVMNAITDLGNAGFHGRDYYPVEGLLSKALEEHQKRVMTLVGIHNELLLISNHCASLIKGGQ